MSKVKEKSRIEAIKHAIEKLTENEFAVLRRWFAEKDWSEWDMQIERDSEAGKLDFLESEALDAKIKGELSKL